MIDAAVVHGSTTTSEVAPPAPPAEWSVAVVIPARDEADGIAACVASVRASLHRAGPGAIHVVVVADRCVDPTAEVARHALGPDGEVIEIDAGRVGVARRQGVERALAALGPKAPPDLTWLASTDADTVVPVRWIGRHLALAGRGAAGVAGVVRLDDLDADRRLARHLLGRRDAIATDGIPRHVHGPDGTHGHVHGANLGVRADAYLAVGGWPRLATAEDHALWRRLGDAGWPLVSSVDAWVTTSGRVRGRAPYGFAHLLSRIGDHASASTGPDVEDDAGSPASASSAAS